MKFNKPSDAVRFLSGLGYRAEWPTMPDAVFCAVAHGESYHVIGTRIWYEVDGAWKGWLDENKDLCAEFESAR